MSGLCNKFFNFVAELDLYADGVGLNVGGKCQSKSIIGTFITIFTLGLCFYLTNDLFWQYWDVVNPSLAFSNEYDTKELNINETNPFISIGFFVPKANSKGYANSTADFNVINTMENVAVSCSDCTIPKDKIFLNNFCDETILDNIKIGTLSSRSSKNLTDIFKTKSFCFPNFNGTIVDDDVKIKNFISSLTLYIPDTYNPNGTDANGILVDNFNLIF